MKFGEILQNYRIQNHQTQKEMSEIFGITQSYYSKYEQNKAKPTLEILYKFSKFYNISADLILEKIYKDTIDNSTF